MTVIQTNLNVQISRFEVEMPFELVLFLFTPKWWDSGYQRKELKISFFYDNFCWVMLKGWFIFFLIWAICASLGKKMTDSSQLILSLILIFTLFFAPRWWDSGYQRKELARNVPRRSHQRIPSYKTRTRNPTGRQKGT